MLGFVLTETLLIVGIVCFMDVFITFFTGELHPDTGLLIPKPFFKRWLIPGLIFQLVVNPQMETITKRVVHLLNGILTVGPIRAYRWAAVLFYPLFQFMVHTLQDHVWRPLVDHQNMHHKQIPTSNYTMRPIDNEIHQIWRESRRASICETMDLITESSRISDPRQGASIIYQ